MSGTGLGAENTVIRKTFSLWGPSPSVGDNHSGGYKNQYIT